MKNLVIDIHAHFIPSSYTALRREQYFPVKLLRAKASTSISRQRPRADLAGFPICRPSWMDRMGSTATRRRLARQLRLACRGEGGVGR
jgi:hypothetical protein